MATPLKIDGGTARSFTIPTDAPEADGTFSWDSTTIIIVTLRAGGQEGLGYTYGHKVVAPLAAGLIEKSVKGADPLDIPTTFDTLRRQQRNYGREGIGALARSAIDIAMWDLKAKLLGLPLCSLLGRIRAGAPVYGSGGFTTYSDAQLTEQLGGWVAQGIPRVKMKIGTQPERDPHRVAVARKAIGASTELFVDANGAYTQTQAVALAERFVGEWGVNWFEEPVSSDDLAGMRFVRQHVPAGMDVAAGEYGWTDMYLRHMLEAEAVDVLQADATRCGGVTGFMAASAMATAQPLPLSAHCGPSIHMHLACAALPLRHVEYFHDHVRIEQMLFDGFCPPKEGVMYPDLERHGLGLTFKQKDAERFHDDL